MIYLSLGIILTTLALYIRFRTSLFSSKQSKINECTEPVLESNEVSTAIIQPDNYKNDKWKELYDPHVDFVNKQCTNLADFIINDEINVFDLKKLCELNHIDLQISKGWYPLTLELIKELNKIGWNKKVTCIKQKWAKLEFYTAGPYNSQIDSLIEEYNEKSESVCETCGDKGQIRYIGEWENVACRKHYLELRNKITTDGNGFIFKENHYQWDEIIDAEFLDRDFNNLYTILKIELKPTKDNNDRNLYINHTVTGFGNLIEKMPKKFKSLDPEYVLHFNEPVFCEICGYKAVYMSLCECCECYDSKTFLSEFPNEDKESNLKTKQMMWKIDEGELYEEQQKNYIKNPKHQLLYTIEDLKRYSGLSIND